jgi:hypothetical protein
VRCRWNPRPASISTSLSPAIGTGCRRWRDAVQRGCLETMTGAR